MSESKDLKHVNHTMYDKMNFPDHEHREFPMAVPVVNGKIMPTPYDDKHKPHPIVEVQSQEELDALRGPEVALVEVRGGSASRVETEDDVREVLYVQAAQVGAVIDKRWSVARIESTIKAQVSKNNGGEVV